MAEATIIDAAAAKPGPAIPGLEAAFRAVAPHAPALVWLPVLKEHLDAGGLTTDRRASAFLGQCAVESGLFTTTSENVNYTHADRLRAVFPSEFPTLAVAAKYVGNPQKIANRCYAGRLGNGNEASGDGYVFRGAGLIQLTGRAAIAAFAKSLGVSDLRQVSDWLRQPAGAAASAVWFWNTRKLNAAADGWQLSAVTLKVNGSAMLAHAERVALSNLALRAFNNPNPGGR
jgi:putative chitinase